MASTSVVAPPFHVASTAAQVRDGFPYFSYHESVSALWQNKWRMPCAHGIYPLQTATSKTSIPSSRSLSGCQVIAPTSYTARMSMQNRFFPWAITWSAWRRGPKRKGIQTFVCDEGPTAADLILFVYSKSVLAPALDGVASKDYVPDTGLGQSSAKTE